MNEKQKKSVKSIYDGYTFYVNENLQRLFSSAISNDRSFESCAILVRSEVYLSDGENINRLTMSTIPDVKRLVHNDVNSIVGRVIRVAELSLTDEKLKAIKPLITNTIWKTVDVVIDEVVKIVKEKKIANT